MELDAEIVAAVRRAIADIRQGVCGTWAKQPPNAPLFLLCQHLLGVPSAADMPSGELLPYFDLFWDTAGQICNDGSLDDSSAEDEFVLLWDGGKVERPKANSLRLAVYRVDNGLSSEPAAAAAYRDPGKRRLLHVCAELARIRADGGRFFISGDAAAAVSGSKPRAGALAMKRFCNDGVLRLLYKGSLAAHKASEYMYLEDHKEK